MNVDSKKVEVGVNVKIIQRNGESANGMVRRVMRKSGDGIVVELLNGAMGKVVGFIPRRARVDSNYGVKKKVSRIVSGRNEISEKELLAGESKNLEYKLSALWSQDLKKIELDNMNTPEVKKYGTKASKIIVAKVIAGFLNSSGGDLVIGIREEKVRGEENVIEGIDQEFRKLKNKDYGEDGYKRMIMDDIIRPHFSKKISNHFNDYFDIAFLKVEGKTLCRINVRKSDFEVFLTIGNEDYFFIRSDTQTRELKGKDVVDYVRRRFE